MDIDKFNALITTEKSTWMDDVRRRKRWKWLNKFTLKPRIKYYILRRKFLKLFIHNVNVPQGTVCDCEDYTECDSGIKWCSVCGRKLS